MAEARMTNQQHLAAAQALKEEGNELLQRGDYEEAFSKYEEGLRHVESELLYQMAPEEQVELLRLRTPLLLNSVLCDLRMNPEDQTRRLALSESRVKSVLKLQPKNVKALFRMAQLHGRAGEFREARELLEKLCQQEPDERAFRAELASLKKRERAAELETAAFWGGALRKGLAEPRLERLEGGQANDAHDQDQESDGSFNRRAVTMGLARLYVMLERVFASLLLLWRSLVQKWGAGRRHDRDHSSPHVL
ncbi:hypothetical protein AB1Y20_001399 [Prymnesium parvum]|uniref:Peptidylprolyl isomerase n=1 Tax=Prymnesium parvum TaxID=97485 RepID=A0AB34KB67_PRYPA